MKIEIVYSIPYILESQEELEHWNFVLTRLCESRHKDKRVTNTEIQYRANCKLDFTNAFISYEVNEK